MPWVKKLVLKKTVILSWIFFGVVCLATLFWIISACMIISASKNDNLTMTMAKFLQFDLIFTIQFIVANFVASTIVRYKKRNIIFQVVAYTSYLFTDFYFTSLALCLKLGGEKAIAWNKEYSEFLIKPIRLKY